MFCAKCGNRLIDGNQFCTRCGAAVAGAAHPKNAPEPEAPKAEETQDEADCGSMSTLISCGLGCIVVLLFFAFFSIDIVTHIYRGIKHESYLEEVAKEAIITRLEEEGVKMNRYEIVEIALAEWSDKEDFYTAHFSIKAPNGEMEHGTFDVHDEKPWRFWDFLSGGAKFIYRDPVLVRFDVEDLPDSLKWEVTQQRRFYQNKGEALIRRRTEEGLWKARENR